MTSEIGQQILLLPCNQLLNSADQFENFDICFALKAITYYSVSVTVAPGGGDSSVVRAPDS